MLKRDIFSNVTEESQNKVFYVLWAIVIFIYLCFNIKIHMHESYVYAGALEGFFDVTEGHYGISPWLVNYNKFGIYHPNHPLLHFLGKFLQIIAGIFNYKLSAISAVSFINTLTGLCGGFLFFKIAQMHFKDKMFATLMALVLMFCDIYWFGAKSGEGYPSGQCFNLLSIYFIFKYFQEKKISYIYFQALSLGIAMAFHSLYVFMLIPQFYLFFAKDKKNLLKISSIIFSIIFIFGMSFYILPLYFHVGAKSLGEMIKIFLFYSDEMGVWTQSIHSFFSIVWGLILYPFVTGVYHLAYTVLEGYHWVFLLGRLILIYMGYKAFKKALSEKVIETRFIIFWFATYFIFTSYILFLPYDITYWQFLMPAFVFILAHFFKDLKFRNLSLLVLASVLFIGNFINDIYPKMKVDTDKYFLIDQITKEIKDDTQIAIVIYDSFAETSYLNYYGIIWSIKHHPAMSGKNIKIIIDDVDLKTKLDELTPNGEKLFILSNTPGEPDKKIPLEKALAEKKYKLVKKNELRHDFDEKLDKTSEFQHIEHWYDLGPEGLSWFMNLNEYSKN